MKKYAICDICHKEMKPGVGCRPRKNILIYEDEDGLICHDCNCKPGQYHHNECDMARCSKCGEQYISCDCSEPDFIKLTHLTDS